MVQWIAFLTRDQGDVGSSPAQGTKTNLADECNSGLMIKENPQLGDHLYRNLFILTWKSSGSFTRVFTVLCN